MSVKKGWTLVGLFLTVVSFAVCQPINLSVYAQPAENTTTDSDPFLFGSPSDSPKSQIPSAQDSLTSAPGPSSLDLDPTTDQESPGARGEAPDQQKVSPNQQFPSNSGPDPTTSSENIVNEQVQNSGDADENAIVQSPALQSQETENRPGVSESEQPNQNRADDDDNNDNNQENTPDSDKQEQQAIGEVNENSDENENENSDSRNDNEENDEEEEEGDEGSSDNDSDSDDIPLEYDIVPFP
jgi:hypothetical protein